jgi:hypothetical protein
MGIVESFMPPMKDGKYDLVMYNADVVTMDPFLPRARLVAIRKGRIARISRETYPDGTSRATEVVDCKGRTVVPGLIDAHCHLAGYAESLVSLDLSPRQNVRSVSDIKKRIASWCRDRPPGTWIRCSGYSEFSLKENRHPTRKDLDEAAPLHPVRLIHRSGHAHVLNSLALDLVGITFETGDPPEGLIDRDPTGEPTGILYGMGAYLSKRMPPLDADEMERGVRLANERLLSYGIASVHDASAHNDLHRFHVLRTWKKRGLFTPRITMMLGIDGFGESGGEPAFRNDALIAVRGVKIIVDETTGRLHPSQTQLNDMVLAIHCAGLQVAIHAIEEPVIEAACNAIEYALQREPRTDHRHRIEHCSVCPPHLRERISRLAITVVSQPSFLYYSGERYLRTVPDRQKAHLYPLGALLKKGVRVAAGSDFPIADPNPWTAIYAAVSRKGESGDALGQEERIGAFEALRMYTEYAAEAAFEETEKGSITVGKAADLVVLSADPMSIDAEELKHIRTVMIIVNGKTVAGGSDL